MEKEGKIYGLEDVRSPEEELGQIEEFVKIEEGMKWASQESFRKWKLGHNYVEKGSFQDIVTEADPVIENCITQVIKDAYPRAKIWGEENGGKFGPDSWGIDPIDGTTVFARGGRDWCNAVIKMEGGKPDFSMIVVPIGNCGSEFYVAKRGKGAFLKEELLGGGERVSRLKTVRGGKLNEATFGMRQEDVWSLTKKGIDPEDGKAARMIHGLAIETRGTNVPGSTSYVLANVAAGRFSLACAGKQSIWDVAPGGLMVEEAGGVVTRLNGSRIDFMAGGIDKKVDWVASGNQSLHREALEVLGLSSRN